MNKTVWDAVNELKGDLGNSYNYAECENYLYFEHGHKQPYIAFIDKNNSESLIYICTTQEFNALVAEMETNFGKIDKYTLGNYKDAVDCGGTKKLKPFNHKFTPLEKEAGLKVGDEVLIPHPASADITALIIHINNDLAWVKASTGAVNRFFNLEAIKPLPPKPELIDGEAYKFDYESTIDIVGICNYEIRHGSEHVMLCRPKNNEKYNSEYCTNIKHLTVNGE